MPELLDFDKDLIHLEAASKVFQLAYHLHLLVDNELSTHQVCYGTTEFGNSHRFN